MNILKKSLCLLLAFLLPAMMCVPAFAGDADEPAPPVPELKSLDTSAVDGKLTAYVGVETYFVVYPEPLEAESRFDIRNAEITCSEEGIVSVKPEKEEQNRFGSVLVTGLKLGRTTVTVTDPGSGVSCSVEVTVRPAFGYRLLNFFSFLDYVPFFVFMWLAGKLGLM